jgi:hypothetical protein
MIEKMKNLSESLEDDEFRYILLFALLGVFSAVGAVYVKITIDPSFFDFPFMERLFWLLFYGFIGVLPITIYRDRTAAARAAHIYLLVLATVIGGLRLLSGVILLRAEVLIGFIVLIVFLIGAIILTTFGSDGEIYLFMITELLGTLIFLYLMAYIWWVLMQEPIADVGFSAIVLLLIWFAFFSVSRRERKKTAGGELI